MVRLSPDLEELGWGSVRRAHSGGWLQAAWKPWLGEDPEATQRAFEALERCVAYLRLAIEIDASSKADSALSAVLWGEALCAFSDAGFASKLDPSEAFALLSTSKTTRPLVKEAAAAIATAFHACGERGLVRLRGAVGGELGQQLERWAWWPEQMSPDRVAALLATAAYRASVVELTKRSGLDGNLQPIVPLVRAAGQTVPRLIGAAFSHLLVPAIEAVAPQAPQPVRHAVGSGAWKTSSRPVQG